MTPATKGDAMDVPLIYVTAVLEVIPADAMALAELPFPAPPGAKIVTQGP